MVKKAIKTKMHQGVKVAQQGVRVAQHGVSVARGKTKTWLQKVWAAMPKEMRQAISSFKMFMLADNLADSGFQQEVRAELTKQIWPAIKFGMLSIAVFVGVFVVWGGLAPLDSASVAHGHVALSGNHKAIQHLHGGTVEDILVHEGEIVSEGQELMRLDDNEQKAKVESLKKQVWTARAMEIRLLAERMNEEELLFEDPLFEDESSELKEILKTQHAYFKKRISVLHDTVNVLTQRVQQDKERIHSYEHQKEALQKQKAILDKEAEHVYQLFEKGLVSNNRYYDTQRSSAKLIGDEASVSAQIAEIKEKISETELQVIREKNDFSSKVEAELREVQEKFYSLRETLQAEKKKLDQTVIRAPTAGVVHGLQHFTIGGVVAPGSKIMDIVPQDDKLIVEARVSPRDIESVRVGLVARVQLSAFKTRLVPRVDGRVIYVSADRFVDDPRSGMVSSGDMPAKPGEAAYYLVKIELDSDSIARINTEINLQPGMPADVFIVKGTRTFLQYLISPILDSFHRAFKEA